MPELKVLMLGGQRVGKSSALAAIMSAFINGPAKDFLTAEDTTVLETKEGSKQKSISRRLSEDRNFLTKNVGKTVLADNGKTNFIWHYDLKLKNPDGNDSMTIKFTDVNGEFLNDGDPQQEEILKLIPQYDVFIVAVDTVFLMEELNPSNKLVSRVINRKYNCRDAIHKFLTEINDADGKDAKLVIFAPIKCERWARGNDNKLNEVDDAVKKLYASTFTHLEQCKAVQIEIIPIQTLGSVVFQEHLYPSIAKWTERVLFFFNRDRRMKCSKLEDCQQVRLANGSIKDVKDVDLDEDMEAVLIPDTAIIRPNSWFKIESAEYRPYNCEQLAYHILDFMLKKRVDFEINNSENQNFIFRLAGWVVRALLDVFSFGLYSKLRDIFGDISVEQMTTIINQFNDKNLIKHQGEGILEIKTCNFKSRQTT